MSIIHDYPEAVSHSLENTPRGDTKSVSWNADGGVPERKRIDVVIVGAGQAGISLSHFLQHRGIEHILLERDRPFSAWVNRWDGFTTNTPNWMNTLPMMPADSYPSNDPSAFATGDEIVEYLQRCHEAVDPPIRTGVEVHRVVDGGSGRWEVHTADTVYESAFVAICNGAMSNPHLPEVASRVPESVPQMHSNHYKNPEQIETGSVLIVGSASSGVQICRLLAESGRFPRIHLAVSKVPVLPRRILWIQTHRFLHALGLFDITSRSLLGRFMHSGLESRGDPIMAPTPKDLSRRHGVRLFPKLVGLEGDLLRFADDQTLSTDDLSIVWCTGFRGDYGFIETSSRAEAFDKSGLPRHVRGIVDAAPGLCFVGLRYQHTVASHDIYGVAADAEYVAMHIHEALLAAPVANLDSGPQARGFTQGHE